MAALLGVRGTAGDQTSDTSLTSKQWLPGRMMQGWILGHLPPPLTVANCLPKQTNFDSYFSVSGLMIQNR